MDDLLKREFCAELRRAERWSSRTLRHNIGHLLFERTAVRKNSDGLITRDLLAPRDEDRATHDMVFRDLYFLDFVGLIAPYVEKDMEQAILRDLQSFIPEIGHD